MTVARLKYLGVDLVHAGYVSGIGEKDNDLRDVAHTRPGRQPRPYSGMDCMIM